jgi:hypothetical protein
LSELDYDQEIVEVMIMTRNILALDICSVSFVLFDHFYSMDLSWGIQAPLPLQLQFAFGVKILEFVGVDKVGDDRPSSKTSSTLRERFKDVHYAQRRRQEIPHGK